MTDSVLPSNRQYDVLALGSVYLDLITTNFPFTDAIETNSETVGGSYLLTAGGSAMNFAKVSAFLGLKPILIGKIGTDDTGKILERLIQQTGILPALIKSGTTQTNIGVSYSNTSGQVITTSFGTSNQDLNSNEITTQFTNYLPQVKYLYLAGFFKLKQLIGFYKQMMTMAREHNVKVILDHGHTGNVATPEERNALLELMAYVDIYLPNQDELFDLWQATDINYAMQRVRSVTPATIVVKQGELGAIGLAGNQLVQAKAFPVASLSTVGAGDSFNAGFLSAVFSSKTLEQAISFANATAALAISQKTLPTKEQIEAFLAQHLTTPPAATTE